MMKTTEQFKKDVLKLLGSDYEVLSEYIGNHKKILIRHNCEKCNNYEWSVEPNSVIQGAKCPKCQHRSYKKTTEEFKQEVFDLVGNEYTVLGEYIHKDKKLLMRHNCDECDNYEWEISPHNFLDNAGRKGRRCPYCSKSKNEKKISEFLRNHDISYIPQKTFEGLIGEGNGLLSYDFYLPKYNLLIEHQGRQHEEFIKTLHITERRFERQLEHDRRKKEYAENNNIKLLEIWYWNFKNMEKILEKELHITDKPQLLHIDSPLNIEL